MEEQYFEQRTDLTEVKASLEDIKQEVRKIIVGQDRMVELLLVALLADGHVLIEGNPGVAKTLTAKILSKTISSNFSRIQFTPDLMPSDVLGTSIFNFKTSEFEFKKGPVFSNIILIDEINRSPAKTQAALFEVMEERQISIDGHRYPMSPPFMIIATQNPIELEGTYRLPEAQMDRFLFRIRADYPSLEDEVKILEGYHKRKSHNDLSSINAVISEEQIEKHQQKARTIIAEDHLIRYIAEIVQKTRHYRDIQIGASPRASLALLASAKALALLRGRDFVTPEDIQFVAEPVIAHRITVAPEREMEGMTATNIVSHLLKHIEVPR